MGHASVGSHRYSACRVRKGLYSRQCCIRQDSVPQVHRDVVESTALDAHGPDKLVGQVLERPHADQLVHQDVE